MTFTCIHSTTNDEVQFKTLQKQFSGDSRFHLSWSRPCTEISVNISAILLGLFQK